MVLGEQLVALFVFLLVLFFAYIYLQMRIKKREKLFAEENKEPLLQMQIQSVRGVGLSREFPDIQ